jgi:scyllo-inositol 2-dehydrogenase (NAD+)
MARLSVGLVGVGRMGRVYARDLATRIPKARLVAVADVNAAAAEEVAREFEVPRFYAEPEPLLDDPKVEAVVIVSPTSTHGPIVLAAAQRRKPIFCEKPLALSLPETAAMKEAVERAGVFFQMGFMRRFDAGYAAAKRRIEQGEVGTPVVFKSSSRDPHRTSLEYADPKSSGGMIIDMGIHDFDLARWFMGDVRTVHAIGGTLAYPELKTVGDLDNAIVSLVFADGRLGVVDLSRNGIYGYDISTELLGTAGTLRIGYLRETPIFVMTKNSVAHDTVPYFMERFAGAYTAQLQNFAENVLAGTPPPITLDDGIEALRVAVAAYRSYETGKPVDVSTVRAIR